MTWFILILILLVIILLFIRVRKVVVYRSEKGRKKEENKGKILEMLKDKNKITNNDVEKMLGVSDATATRYLDELEKEGKIRQVGRRGRGVFYEII